MPAADQFPHHFIMRNRHVLRLQDLLKPALGIIVLMVENDKRVWGYDWWEGEDYVELVGYAPMDILAEEIVEWSCSKSNENPENQ